MIPFSSSIRWLRLIGLLPVLLILTLTACGGRSVNMNIVVFNYWHRALADVYVNDRHAGAGFSSHYKDGGTGGSIVCCLPIRPGNIKISWMLGGGPTDTDVGKIMSTTTTLDSIKPGAKYLGVYLYEDGTVELDTGVGIPAGKSRY